MARCYNRATRPQERQLTPREKTVLNLIWAGLRDKQIAENLGLSPHTIRMYVKHLFDKTGASNKVELLWLTTRRQNGL